MRFGFNINLKNSPDEIIQLGEKELSTGNFQAVEITYHENLDGIDTFPYNKALHEIVDKYTPQVTVHISNFDAAEQNTTIRSAILHEFYECCQYVHSFGGSEIIMHNGFIRRNLRAPLVDNDGNTDIKAETKECWELAVNMLQMCCDLAKEKNINVYTENLGKGCLTPGADELCRFVQDVGRDNLGVVFDIGHSHLLGEKADDEVYHYGELLKHLHLHDNHGTVDEHLPIGEGNIDFPPFLKTLIKVNYHGLYMMEIAHATPEKLEKSRAHLLEMMQHA